MYALFRTFFLVLALHNYAVKCTLLHFMNHGKNVGFNFSRSSAHINRVMW